MTKFAFKILLATFIPLCIFFALLESVGNCDESQSNYYATIAKWTSYKDVYDWLEKNFTYDYERKGRYGKQPLSPSEMFRLQKSACYDSANFVIDALNRINPDYKANPVFIKNKFGPPHHWVTAFTVDGKLFVMDYGASIQWGAMNGIHGPYKSLSDYYDFLSSLRIKGFSAEDVMYRDINFH
jgi:predicted transglutaminase-like protease